MQDITIYTKDHCPYCERAKEQFQIHDLAYREVVLTSPEQFDELKEKTGHMTVPQIFVGDTFIGGYDDLMAQWDAFLKNVRG